MQYQKVKSAPKLTYVKGEKLEKLILKTMGLISDIVGATLGPGGQPVLIEREDANLPPMVTKDGVTVFRNLGLNDAAEQCVMEAARDTATRTAADAGDGTTCSSILAAEIVAQVFKYTKKNPTVSPQKIVRHLEKVFSNQIDPIIQKLARKVDVNVPEGRQLLHSVAKVSANGDVALADVVMDCFDIIGDDGNVTIEETSGPSHYEVEKIEGFPIRMGFDESCAKYYAKFINDPNNQRTVLERPVFILYHGRLNEFQNVVPALQAVGNAFQVRQDLIEGGASPDACPVVPHNVVLVACGFSDSALAALALNFAEPSSLIKCFPLLAPQSPQLNGQAEFLHDLSAITGARVLDQMNTPLQGATLADLGPGVKSFEATRYRSTVVGYADEGLRLMRIDQLKEQMGTPESELDKVLLNERVAKMSGGVAKLHVVGASNGELKEKRDRAEDAICAVRGAMKHGVLPAGGWTLLKLCNVLTRDPITDAILRPAFAAPVKRLLQNSGIVDDDEAMTVLAPVLEAIKADGPPIIYDLLDHKHVDAYEAGLLDSTPAVLEAIRNSISIASQIGTMGGIIVFARDHDLERAEASNTAEFLRNANTDFTDRT